jgi:hypothetical protein
MNHPSELLRYREEDRIPLPVEELSREGRISCAFIRLCLSAGCPAQGGRLSMANLLEWLFEHYVVVRRLAGMKAMPEVDGVTEEAATQLHMGNAMITLLEFSELRATRPEDKRQLQAVKRCVEQALDRM